MTHSAEVLVKSIEYMTSLPLGDSPGTQVVSDDSEDEVEWISNANIDEEVSNRFMQQAMEKIPEECNRIITQYGALEYIMSDDTVPVVTGVAEPKGYLRKKRRVEY